MLALVLPLALQALQAATPLPLEVARLSAPDGARDVGFGEFLDMDGDWLAVSAPGSQLAGNGNGVVHVYRRAPTGPGVWSFTQSILPPPSSSLGDVKLSGATMAVGIQPITGGGIQPPSWPTLQLYELEGGLWYPTTLVSAPGPDPGFAKAFDLDGGALAVGAGFNPCYFGGTLESVYVYERNAGGSGAWGNVALRADGYPGGGFGSRLMLRDGRLLVATPFLGGPCQGGYDDAHLYGRNVGGVGNWGLEAELSTPNAGAAGYFGAQLTMSSSIGLSAFDGLHLFELDDSGWNEFAILGNSSFGGRVAAVLLADERLYVGSWTTASRGEVYVLDRDPGTPSGWSARRSLFPSDSAAGDGFGDRVVGSGNRLAVVARGTETVFLFETAPARPGTAARAPSPSPR